MIKERPFNEGCIDDVLKECEIRFVERKGFPGVIYQSNKKNISFIIEIDKNRPLKIQKLTLLHELLHVYYKCHGYGQLGQTRRERLIEKEARRLYKDKLSLVEFVFKKIEYKNAKS